MPAGRHVVRSEGLAVGQPDHPTDEWLRKHRWAWRRSRLRDAIQDCTIARRPVRWALEAVSSRASCVVSSNVSRNTRSKQSSISRWFTAIPQSKP